MVEVPYEDILPTRDAEYVRQQHGRHLGRALHIVTVGGDFTSIRVIPTACGGNVPYGDRSYVWATVEWSSIRNEWICSVNNLPGKYTGDRTFHGNSVKSALRRARKVVNKYAPEPNDRWLENLELEPLTSLYPTESRYSYTKSMWAMLKADEQEMEEELMYDEMFGDEYDDGYDDYYDPY